jgi:hypothetical protein
MAASPNRGDARAAWTGSRTRPPTTERAWAVVRSHLASWTLPPRPWPPLFPLALRNLWRGAVCMALAVSIIFLFTPYQKKIDRRIKSHERRHKEEPPSPGMRVYRCGYGRAKIRRQQWGRTKRGPTAGCPRLEANPNHRNAPCKASPHASFSGHAQARSIWVESFENSEEESTYRVAQGWQCRMQACTEGLLSRETGNRAGCRPRPSGLA